MKILSLLYVLGLFLFLLPVAGNAKYNTHRPTVLIVQGKKEYEKIIKRKAYDNVMQIFESRHDDIEFVNKIIDFSDKNDTHRTKRNLNQFIQENKNIVYIVFMPGDTSKYNQTMDYLPKKIPIITSIGTAGSLAKPNIWVTTISSLAKGKAIAIEKLMKMEKKDEIIVLYDKAIDTYTNEILQHLKKELNVSVTQIEYTKEGKLENPQKLKEKNKLILLDSKSSDHAKVIFENFKTNIYCDINHENDILLLKNKKEDREGIYLEKSKIFYLNYKIPGYNPDLRLTLYQEIEDICDNREENNKNTCLKIYGDAYIKLYTYLNLALSTQDITSNNTISSETNITKMRENIHNNISERNKTNIYYHKNTNALAKFKQSENFYYSALIESNITNYYIVRLDNKNNGFLHYNQISNGDEDKNSSLSTIYLDMKVSNLIVANLSATSAYIEGNLRVLTTKKQFDLDKMYRINSINSVLKKSEIIFVKDNKKMIDGMEMYEKFYTFKGNFNINNHLFYFPFDKQKIYISFTPRDTNATHDGFLMHLQKPYKEKMDFDKWYIDDINPFLSTEIIMFNINAIEQSSSLSYKPISNFEITIHRKTAIGFMMKFIFPIFIILTLVVGTQIYLHKRRDLGVGISIYISAFAGIISIYFIFNLLIDIESLIGFDFVFLSFLSVPIGLMVYNIYRYSKK
jgi:hypothetical protein